MGEGQINSIKGDDGTVPRLGVCVCVCAHTTAPARSVSAMARQSRVRVRRVQAIGGAYEEEEEATIAPHE